MGWIGGEGGRKGGERVRRGVWEGCSTAITYAVVVGLKELGGGLRLLRYLGAGVVQ